MVKRIQEKRRGITTMSPKKIILMATEGKNKTEENYFRSLSKESSTYVVKFVPGNDTDPISLINNTINYANDVNSAIDYSQGDIACCVFDTDFGKEEVIQKSLELACKNNISIFLSNPCFEVWFLQHFRYSTKQYIKNDEVINELSKVMDGYNKSDNIFEQIYGSTDKAIKNSEKLKKYHKNNHKTYVCYKCNPSTDVNEIVKIMISEKKEK